MFCRCYFKKIEKTSKKEAKKGGKSNSLCRDMIFVCRNTKFKQAKGTMSQPSTKCSNKAQTELNGWKGNFIASKSFFCRDIIEEDCEENCRDNN